MSITNLTDAFEAVQVLINDFENNINHYLSPGYQEAEVRKEYIDKFFTALGWDVDHNHQKNPQQQEVKIEKAQRQQGAIGQKRADYAFSLAPNYKQTKFFVEAKKPSRTLRQNKDDYFQTAKYGWNAGTGISILTDFEELVIIDCRFKPDIDTILATQLKYYHFADFRKEDVFEELYWLFSREAVEAGNLERHVEDLPKPKGIAKQLKMFGGKYQSIDESFLNYIDQKRQELAAAFYQNNKTLDAYSLTEATQRTIDRIVFIRFLEDKLIETDSHINAIANSSKPWVKFIEISKQLNAKYNGIVFKPLFIDDKNFAGADENLFRELCSELDHTNSPYDFNYIPIHILGSIYERFLGKVVTISEGKASIEIKPEVRKAGGVFYTPKYIVDYIVKNTIGVLIDNKSPKQISELTFADIACGSGSFLIGVFEYLLDYHNKYYNLNPEQAKKDGCKFDQDNGIWVLSIKQKQQILLNNIYGVDIDLQATEVTQLSLFLKMLEDETTATANDMMVLFHETILPNLTNNIKCGNSLIGTDILTTKLDLDLENERTLNPFDFDLAFPKIFKKAGFDAVVGNPPYVDIKGLDKINVDYFFKNYSSCENRINLYAIFIEKVMRVLKPNGYLSYIIPNSILFQSSYLKLRSLLLEKYSISEIIKLPDNIFKDANVETIILTLNSTKKTKKDSTHIVIYDNKIKLDSIDYSKAIKIEEIDNSNWQKHPLKIFDIFSNEKVLELLKKIENKHKILEDFCDFALGITPYDKYKGHTEEQIKNRVFHSKTPRDETFKKLLDGSNVSRYFISNNCSEYISYGKWLGATREQRFFVQERILIRQIISGKPLRIYAGYTNEELYNTQSIFNLLLKKEVKVDIKYILGIINSNLMNFYHAYKYLDLTKDTFQKILIQNCKNFPIPEITKSNLAIHDKIVQIVDQIIATKIQQIAAITERDINYLAEKVNSFEIVLNNLVYDLYNISDEHEKEIIEKFNTK